MRELVLPAVRTQLIILQGSVHSVSDTINPFNLIFINIHQYYFCLAYKHRNHCLWTYERAQVGQVS